MTRESHGLEKGLTYRLKYRAVNEIGEGPWSDVTYVRAATLPKAPPSPVVALADANRIDLILGRTSDDGGTTGAAYRYQLYANEGADGTPFHAITAYDGSSQTYSVLAGDDIGSSGFQFVTGSIYTFKYTAINEVGESEARYLAPHLRVAMGGAPSMPVQPVVDEAASNETSIKLDWPLPSTTDDLEVQRYLLWSDLAIPGSSHVILNSTALSVPTFTHTGL